MYNQHRHILVKDAIVLVEGGLRFDEFIEAWRLTAKAARGIEKAREQQARRLVIHWPKALTDTAAVAKLAEVLKPYAGGECGVVLKYTGESAGATLALDEQWSVRPAPDLIERLGELFGRDNLRVLYGPSSSGKGAGNNHYGTEHGS
jgi:DNA polymerase-3 subunit alpha